MDCKPGSDDYKFRLDNFKGCSILYADNEDGSLRYYCKITGNFCVAEKYGLLDKLSKIASINPKILDRCPSREELSDSLMERKKIPKYGGGW